MRDFLDFSCLHARSLIMKLLVADGDICTREVISFFPSSFGVSFWFLFSCLVLFVVLYFVSHPHPRVRYRAVSYTTTNTSISSLLQNTHVIEPLTARSRFPISFISFSISKHLIVLVLSSFLYQTFQCSPPIPWTRLLTCFFFCFLFLLSLDTPLLDTPFSFSFLKRLRWLVYALLGKR